MRVRLRLSKCRMNSRPQRPPPDTHTRNPSSAPFFLPTWPVGVVDADGDHAFQHGVESQHDATAVTAILNSTLGRVTSVFDDRAAPRTAPRHTVELTSIARAIYS